MVSYLLIVLYSQKTDRFLTKFWKDCKFETKVNMRGGTPRTGIIFWRAGPLQYWLPLLGECSRSPPAGVRQLWEAVFGPLHDGWFTRAPAHTSLGIQQFLTKNSKTPMPHPPYSPNLMPSDFFLFPQMKKFLTGKRFADMEEVKQTMAEALKGIKIDKFKNCFE